MTVSTKIEFQCRRVTALEDITDLVEMLFPGNRNQQHAGGRILMALKAAEGLVRSFASLETQFGLSRRTLQRTRAKLARLGMIERISWMNSRYGGDEGWKVSGRMSTGLRQLADRIDAWRKDDRPDRKEKDEMLVGLIG